MTLTARVIVWRESRWPMRPHHEAWHARVNGCGLTVGVFVDGSIQAVVERRRASDGGIDTLASKLWRPPITAACVLDARNWCEATARAVSA